MMISLLMLLILTSLIILTRSQLNTETMVIKFMSEISANMDNIRNQDEIDETRIQQIRKYWNRFGFTMS